MSETSQLMISIIRGLLEIDFSRIASKLVMLISVLSYTLRCDVLFFFFSSRRRHTRFDCDWSSDVCSSDLIWGDHRCWSEHGHDPDCPQWVQWQQVRETRSWNLHHRRPRHLKQRLRPARVEIGRAHV